MMLFVLFIIGVATSMLAGPAIVDRYDAWELPILILNSLFVGGGIFGWNECWRTMQETRRLRARVMELTGSNSRQKFYWWPTKLYSHRLRKHKWVWLRRVWVEDAR